MGKLSYVPVEQYDMQAVKDNKSANPFEDIAKSIGTAANQTADQLGNAAGTVGSSIVNSLPEIAGGIAGGIIGGIAGGNVPAGVAIGAGAARFAHSKLEGASTNQATLAGSLEAGGTLLGGKALELAGRLPIVKPALEALDEFTRVPVEKAAQGLKTLKVKLGNFAANVMQQQTPAQQEQIASGIGDLLAGANIPKGVTQRLLSTGPDNMLAEKYTSDVVKRRALGDPLARRDVLSGKTIGSVSGIADSIMNQTKDEYGKALTNILGGEEAVNTAPLSGLIKDNLQKAFNVGNRVKETDRSFFNQMTGLFQKGKQAVPVANQIGHVDPKSIYEADIQNRINGLIDNVNEYILSKQEVPLLQLHELKRALNDNIDVLYKKSYNSAADSLRTIRDEVVNTLESANPNYKAVNLHYREMNDLANSLKGLSTEERVNVLLDNYYRNPAIRDKVDLFLKNSKPEVQKLFNDAIDEKGATYFFQGNPRQAEGYKTLGGQIPGTGLGVGAVQVGGITREGAAKKIFKKGILKFKQPKTVTAAQAIGRVGTSEIFNTPVEQIQNNNSNLSY